MESHDVRLRKCTCVRLHKMWCSAVYTAVSCRVVLVCGGAAGSHGGGRRLPSEGLPATTQLAHQGGRSGRRWTLLTETAAQVLCRDSRLSRAGTCRAVRERETWRSHDVRLRKCTCVRCTRCGCSAVYTAVSCRVLLVCGALQEVTVAENACLPALRA